MTFREAFVAASRRLAAAPHRTESPDLDARVLLAHSAGLETASLLARWSDAVDDATERRFHEALDRRFAGEPVAWITGFKEFLGLEFAVPPGLLVPRADTETLVEAALELAGELKGLRVLDLCTGTGCVAIGFAALLRWPAEVWAGDLSSLAVETARTNAVRLLGRGRTVNVVETDLMAALDGTWDFILSNPPYLTPDETSDRVGRGGWLEPALALDGGGPDGLQLIRRLTQEAAGSLRPGGWLLLEAAGSQMPALRTLFFGCGLEGIRTWNDLAGVERVIGGRRS